MKARDNPFASGRLERVLAFDPVLAGTTWEEIDRRWEALGRRACVVGRHGAGKTTFLDRFAGRLGLPVRRLRFDEENSRLGAGDREALDELEGVVLVVDGDGHLPWRERRELARAAVRAAGFLSARHRAAGLPVLCELRVDAWLARKLLERAAPELEARFAVDLESRLRRRRGNLRELWLDCYDELAMGKASDINTF